MEAQKGFILTQDEQQEMERVQEAMKVIVDAVNRMPNFVVAHGMYNGLINGHRTLQAGVIRAFQKMAEEYGNTEYKDLRNEAAVEFCKKIAKIDHYIPYI